jgi:glycosyltransferase 2 family protein
MKTDTKRLLKRVLFVGKLLLAGVLLVWVLSQAHWHDYVEVKPSGGGGHYAVDPDQSGVPEAHLRVRQGVLWWTTVQVMPTDHFRTVAGEGILRRGIRTSLMRMRIPFFVLAVLAYPICLVLMGIRLWYLLHAQEMRISLWEAVRQTFLGQFFNQIVPGTVGGDLVKAWYLSRMTHRTAAVLVTLFVDRLMGLVELALMSSAMLLLVLGAGWETVDQLRLPIIAVGVVLALSAGVLLFVLSPGFRRLLHLEKLWRKLPIAHHIEAAGRSVALYRRRPAVLAVALLITVAAHVFFIGAAMMIGLALRMEPPVLNYFIYVPLIYVIGAVPVTPGGVGLVEKLYVEFFSSPLVGTSTIVTLAMLARLLPALWGLPGLIVALRSPKIPETDQIEKELEQAEHQEIN